MSSSGNSSIQLAERVYKWTAQYKNSILIAVFCLLLYLVRLVPAKAKPRHLAMVYGQLSVHKSTHLTIPGNNRSPAATERFQQLPDGLLCPRVSQTVQL